jgi:N-methylhydantoinase B/oxoprolinase/acetone carboxylase alpha subunit
VMPGDVFFVESSGGGGYGDPARRDPRAIAEDVANGVVTRTRGPRPKRASSRPARQSRGRV